MEFTYKFIDIDDLPEGHPPVDVFDKKPNETWLCLVDVPTSWSMCTQGEMVAVPLLPFITGSVEPSLALLQAFQTGINIMVGTQGFYEAEECRISMAYQVEEVQLPDQPDGVHGFKYWLGIAFRFKR